jgi:hypothetical protein
VRWPDEKLEKLSREELQRLLENLAALAVDGRVSSNEVEDTTRRIAAQLANRRAARSKKAAGAATLERRVADQLGNLAHVLAKRFDLSESTARSLSRGVKRFSPHALTDKRGQAKTGGSMKGGRTAIDRYISYRLRDSLVSVAFILPRDTPEESGRFVVLATNDLTTEGVAIREFLPDAEYGWSAAIQERMRALPFTVFDAAASKYGELLGKIAPPLVLHSAAATA